MIKKSFLLLSGILFFYTFNHKNVIALQEASDYPISSSKKASDKSSKTIKHKIIKPQEIDETETLFSVKGAIKDAGHAVKDTAKKVGNTAKKGAEKAADLAKKGAKTAKKGAKKAADLGKKGAEKIKTGVQKAFKMSVDFAQKVPWTVVFKEGLKIAVPTLKGCIKSSIVAAVPAVMAGPETLGLGTVGTLAGACAIGGAKSSIPAILGVTVSAFNSWSNKKKSNEIQKQIDLNQQDANAVGATISQAKTAESTLKSKDEKDAAEIAIAKAKGTKSTINNFVGQLKAEQKKYK